MELTGEALTRTCERLFALACARRADTGFVAETLLAYTATGALAGTYVGAGNRAAAAAVRAKSSADVVVVDEALSQVPDLLRTELALAGAVAAIHLRQVLHPDGSCEVIVVAAWPQRGVAPAFGAQFTADQDPAGPGDTSASTRWLEAVLTPVTG